MSYDTIKLERGGTTIMYFAPTSEVLHQDSNDLTEEALPNDNPAFLYNMNRVMGEVTVQGQFQNKKDYPDAHQTALENLLGTTGTISASDQMNYLRGKTLWSANTSLLELYTEGANYKAKTVADIDAINGVYPACAISELRFPDPSGKDKINFMVKFAIGTND